MSNSSPGGITFGPWLVTSPVAVPTVTVAVEEMSRHTIVASWSVVAAALSSTSTRVALAATSPVQVTVRPCSATVAPLLASVNVVPIGAVTVTSTPVTGASPVLVSSMREG